MMDRMRSGLRGLVLVAVGLCALLLSGCYPPVSESDPYVAVAYSTDEISLTSDVIYGQGVRVTGETVDLKLDVFAPPSSGNARPTLVLAHGGGFIVGSKERVHGAAREWAQRGYVVVALGYRLGVPPREAVDAINAGSDGQLAIRWLRANAATFDIDPDRLALLGSSAGSAIGLITALDLDLNGNRPGPNTSHIPTAAGGTGATLVEGIRSGLVTSEMPAAPLLVHHYQLDTVTGATDGDAKAMCAVWQEAEQNCNVVVSAGAGHTVSLLPTEAFASESLMPFLAVELDLANAPTP